MGALLEQILSVLSHPIFENFHILRWQLSAECVSLHKIGASHSGVLIHYDYAHNFEEVE